MTPTPAHAATPPAERPAAGAANNPVSVRRRIAWIAGGVLCVLVLAFGFGLYRYQWHGGVTEVVTKVLPYPAAIVNGSVIRWSDFSDELSALERFYAQQRAAGPSGAAYPSESDLKQRVLDRLVKDALAAQLASRYGITVTSVDVDKAYDGTILDQSALGTATGKAKAETRAAASLQQMYGLDPAQFKNAILRPLLVRQKLQAAIQGDETLNAENRKKAEKALAELKAGKPFKDVAAAYSEDSSVTATGGDRGWVGRGLLPPEVEAAAFALAPGETSGVVKSAFGYHVLRVTDVQKARGQVTKVHLQEILVKPVQIDDYLEAQKDTASIIAFIH